MELINILFITCKRRLVFTFFNHVFAGRSLGLCGASRRPGAITGQYKILIPACDIEIAASTNPQLKYGMLSVSSTSCSASPAWNAFN